MVRERGKGEEGRRGGEEGVAELPPFLLESIVPTGQSEHLYCQKRGQADKKSYIQIFLFEYSFLSKLYLREALQYFEFYIVQKHTHHGMIFLQKGRRTSQAVEKKKKRKKKAIFETNPFPRKFTAQLTKPPHTPQPHPYPPQGMISYYS